MNGQLRLVGGATPNEGRLEICYANHWGTVCDDLFDSTDAALACKLLGFSPNSERTFDISLFPDHCEDLNGSANEDRFHDVPIVQLLIFSCC